MVGSLHQGERMKLLSKVRVNAPYSWYNNMIGVAIEEGINKVRMVKLAFYPGDNLKIIQKRSIEDRWFLYGEIVQLDNGETQCQT